MKIVAYYDFNGGKSAIENNYSLEYKEIKKVITNVNSSLYKTKVSKEDTMNGVILYDPHKINNAFKTEFNNLNSGWIKNKRIKCEYKYGVFLSNYIKPEISKMKPFRSMDFIKNNKKLGIEVQFGKYAFMVYNVCAKMTIFNKLGLIDTGIEIVPVKHFANEMSTGVSYFEQFAWDLHHRGMSNIDIPVLILGVDA